MVSRCCDDGDPRPKLQKLAKMRDRLGNKSSMLSVQRLLRDWGITSPSALEVACALNELLEAWVSLLVEKVGLIKG